MDSDEAAFATALRRPDRVPPGLRAWNGSDPARRFAVYRNNVVVGLVEALAATFPAVKRLVGEEFFGATAAAYIRAEPPVSPILAEYGRGFGAFLDGFEPAAALPYLGDVARLEFAMLEAFHAADAPVLVLADLAGLAPDTLAGRRFTPHPATRLVASRHAIVTLVTANRAPDPVPPIDAGVPERALVTRPGLETRLTALSPSAWALAAALVDGATLGEAAERHAQAEPGGDLGAAIGLVIAAGAFRVEAGEGH